MAEELPLGLLPLDAGAGFLKNPVVVNGLATCPYLQGRVGEAGILPLRFFVL